MLVAYADFTPMREDGQTVTFSNPQTLTANRQLPIVGDDINGFFSSNTKGTTAAHGDEDFSFFYRKPIYSGDSFSTSVTSQVVLFDDNTQNVNNTLLGKNRMKAVGDCFVFGGSEDVHIGDGSVSIANKYTESGLVFGDATIIESGSFGEFACHFTKEPALVENNMVDVISIRGKNATIGNAFLIPEEEYPDTSNLYTGNRIAGMNETITEDMGPISRQWRKEFTGYITKCNMYLDENSGKTYVDPNSFQRLVSDLPQNSAYGFLASGGEVESSCSLGLTVLGNFSEYYPKASAASSLPNFETNISIELLSTMFRPILPAPFRTNNADNTWTDNMEMKDVYGFIIAEDDLHAKISTFNRSVVSKVVEGGDGSKALWSQYRIGQYLGNEVVDPVMSLWNRVQIKRYDSYQIATAGNREKMESSDNYMQLRQVKEVFPSVPVRLTLAKRYSGEDGVGLYGFAPYSGNNPETAIVSAFPACVYELGTRTTPRLMANFVVRKRNSALPVMHVAQLYNTLHTLDSKFECYPVETPEAVYGPEFASRINFTATATEASTFNTYNVTYITDDGGTTITGIKPGIKPSGTAKYNTFDTDYSIKPVCTMMYSDGTPCNNMFAMDFTTSPRCRSCHSPAHTSYFIQSTDV